MKSGLDTILFDLDNTLVETDFNYVCAVIRSTFRTLGKNFDYDTAERFWYCSGRSHFPSERLGVDDERFWKLYRARNMPKNYCSHTEAFDDIDFLDDLKKAGYKTGIVTSSPEYMGKPIVKKIGEGLFDAVVYQNVMHGFRHKPEPDGIFAALEKLDSKPENSAYVGDTEGDMESAKRAGVFPVFIDRRTHSIKHNIDVPLKVTCLYCIGTYLGLEGY